MGINPARALVNLAATMDVIYLATPEQPIGSRRMKGGEDDRNLKSTISYLKDKVDDFEAFFSDDWARTEEGQIINMLKIY